MDIPLTNKDDILNYLKFSTATTCKLSQCIQPHTKEVLQKLFLRVNWMRTWFRTHHPSLMYKEGTPFQDVRELFKTVAEADMQVVFAVWCVHLIQTFPVDTVRKVGDKEDILTYNYDVFRCIRNVISDITCEENAKPLLEYPEYPTCMKTILKANLLQDANVVTNSILAAEIETILVLRSAESRSQTCYSRDE